MVLVSITYLLDDDGGAMAVVLTRPLASPTRFRRTAALYHLRMDCTPSYPRSRVPEVTSPGHISLCD
jgi:hypothetical protein